MSETSSSRRSLILGTAGHIDHGKTALIRALTGIDTDRLPQEKQRGITIDIGFAHLDFDPPVGRVGIVDVPGHERFVKNMLAGAAGVDVAMLVIAADDSVMPQTREHLAILDILQIQHGLIAITKCDLSESDWLDLVEDDLTDLVRGTFLEGAPIVRTSVVSGEGIDDLRTSIFELCQKIERETQADLFVLPVDRTFVMPGLGTVVAGTVHSGVVATGDELDWWPRGERVRVRGLQSHGAECERVGQGQRAAINLSNVHYQDIERGHVLAAPGYLRPARILTARIDALADCPWPIKDRARVRLYLDTQEIMAEVRLLDARALEPGERGFAQLRAEEPFLARAGQPLVIRSQSPLRTLGGGVVVQPNARPIRRSEQAVLSRLENWLSVEPRTRAADAIRDFGHEAWTPEDLRRTSGLPWLDVQTSIDALREDGTIQPFPVSPTRTLQLHRDSLETLLRRATQVIERQHKQRPLAARVPRSHVVQQLGYLDEDLVQALIQHLVTGGTLQGDETSVSASEFRPQLSAAQSQWKSAILSAYEGAAFKPPDPNSLATQVDASARDLQPIIELCVSEGQLVHLSGGLHLHQRWHEELTTRVRAALSEHGQLTMSEIRELLDTSR